MIHHLFRNTCFAVVSPEVKVEGFEGDYFHKYIIELFANFLEIPASLQRLCLLTIRSCMTNSRTVTKERFKSLGLPPTLYSIVTLERLAEDIIQMSDSRP